MPSRKQRRRREKDFRHDVRVFEVDEEGNEVPIAELRTRDERPAKTNAKAQRQRGGSGRLAREVAPPSWQRAIRRGGMMGGGMLLVFLFVLKSGPLPERIGIGLVYMLGFIPLTYYVDRAAYRRFEKRKG